MILLYIALIVSATYSILKFFVIDTKYKSNKKAKEKSDKIYEATTAFITLFIGVYSIILNDAYNSKRPHLELTYNCSLDSFNNMSGMYEYDMSLTNDGDIDAQVTSLEIIYHQTHYMDNNRDYFDKMFTIPANSSRKFIQKRGVKQVNPNFILANYSFSYTSSNGNGDIIEGDTIFCK